jgi:hypothetical protein
MTGIMVRDRSLARDAWVGRSKTDLYEELADVPRAAPDLVRDAANRFALREEFHISAHRRAATGRSCY